MGCCYSCKEDSSSQNGDSSERTHLLADPVSNNTSIQRVHSEDFVATYPSSLPKKTDEQSALNRILQETATNVIDVAALGAHNLEQHEYMERMKHYTVKLQGVPGIISGQSKWSQSRRTPCLLVDIPLPEKILAAPPIHVEDLLQITRACDKATLALSSLKVEHREELVVPFRIP